MCKLVRCCAFVKNMDRGIMASDDYQQKKNSLHENERNEGNHVLAAGRIGSVCWTKVVTSLWIDVQSVVKAFSKGKPWRALYSEKTSAV